MADQDTSTQTSRRTGQNNWAPAMLLVLADLLALEFCFALSVIGLLWYGDYFGHWEAFSKWRVETGLPQALIGFFFSILIIMAFWFQGLYSRRTPFWDELLSVIRIVSFLSLAHGALVLAAKWPLSRFVWLASWILSLILIPYCRYLSRRILQSLKVWQKPTYILGTGPNAALAYTALQSERSMGYQVLGFLHPPQKGEGASAYLPPQIPVLDLDFKDVLAFLKKRDNPHLILALESEELQQQLNFIQELTVQYPTFSWIPDVHGLPLFGMETSHFFSHEVLLLTVKNNLANPFSRFLKRGLDFLGSLFLIIALSPLFLYLTWQIRRTKGPAIFSHERVGRDGKHFPCYKFRTMVPNAEEVLQKLLSENPEARREWEKDFKLKNDPRITPIGHFLRQSSLDELPQLWNVLRGDMSLVGPRPVTEAELSRYESKVIYYLASRPGLTGLWQVSGRNDVTYATRTSMDAWYVKNWNLWYDVAILVKTVGVVLKKRGAY